MSKWRSAPQCLLSKWSIHVDISQFGMHACTHLRIVYPCGTKASKNPRCAEVCCAHKPSFIAFLHASVFVTTSSQVVSLGHPKEQNIIDTNEAYKRDATFGWFAPQVRGCAYWGEAHAWLRPRKCAHRGREICCNFAGSQRSLCGRLLKVR
jgi:hypothetical protein